ncbi:sugar phosphate nucleotidyltransferase [Dehalobacterium formicoaceticum]|uniref:sugar phosphate nucleotidyltransferase n=1 Tax=Dehalobacterium formicoaceticum TaxID=51515 RepID=UPI000B7CD860|nr:sugar phosphate nucleotidyltransferase [Dehalobacterium formicoaceticum]
MKAIIMAGGEGSRLRPLTCDRPKPMVPVMDRPIMQHIVQLLWDHNFRDIGATLMYLPEDIKDYFGDGSDYGVNMQYFIEETPLGTAGSVKNAQEFLDETFLVISGDALTDFDLNYIMSFHQKKKAAVTIALTRVPTPLEYGVIITDEAGSVQQFLEKPSWGEVFSDTVNTGIYVIEPEVLKLVPNNTVFDFSKDLFPLLLSRGIPIYGCVMPGYWCDIGNLAQYQQAHYDILAGETNISCPGSEIAEGIWVGSGTEIHPEAYLEGPSFIGQNVKIGKGAKVSGFSVIGSNSILEENASVKKGIIWNNVYLGKKSSLCGGVIANRVKIKSHTSIYEEGVIGDDTILNSYVTIKPGVKIWPHKTVEKGAVVQESLIWADQAKKHLFGANGVTGTVNVELTPEMAVRLGSAFGSCSKKEGQIVLGADGYPCSQMIKNALAIGLTATGCNVLDFNKVVTPISRYGVRTLGINGGIQVHALEQGEKVCITFLNRQGTNITKSEERKIENAFYREDFRRVAGSQVTDIKNYPDIVSSYFEDLEKSIDGDIIRNAHLKIYLDYDFMNFDENLPGMLENIGCEVIFSEGADLDHRFNQDLRWYQQRVVDLQCDLGAIFQYDGEKMILIDNLGHVIQDDLYMVLVSLLVMKTHQDATIVVPVTASQVIEDMAKKYQGKVIRTKTAKQFYMQQMIEDKIVSTQKGYKQYILQFDAINALVYILEFMAKEKIPLSEIMALSPEFYQHQKAIECPWHAKGTVMRKLIEEQSMEEQDGGGKQGELLDGVKVYHENGWALVLPDSDEPICRIFSEGVSMETAEELTAMYADKINNYKKE